MNKSETKKIISEIITLLKESGDMILIKELRDELDKIYDKEKVTVKYTGVLNAHEKSEIHKYIDKKFSKYSEINFVEDDSLIGGFQIFHKDFVLDNSVITKLKKLKNA